MKTEQKSVGFCDRTTTEYSNQNTQKPSIQKMMLEAF